MKPKLWRSVAELKTITDYVYIKNMQSNQLCVRTISFIFSFIAFHVKEFVSTDINKINYSRLNS